MTCTTPLLTFVDQLVQYRKLLIDLADTAVKFLRNLNGESGTCLGGFGHAGFDGPYYLNNDC
jgi:hypothetical protein